MNSAIKTKYKQQYVQQARRCSYLQVPTIRTSSTLRATTSSIRIDVRLGSNRLTKRAAANAKQHYICFGRSIREQQNVCLLERRFGYLRSSVLAHTRYGACSARSLSGVEWNGAEERGYCGTRANSKLKLDERRMRREECEYDARIIYTNIN